jgi:hypothetical protein
LEPVTTFTLTRPGKRFAAVAAIFANTAGWNIPGRTAISSPAPRVRARVATDAVHASCSAW